MTDFTDQNDVGIQHDTSSISAGDSAAVKSIGEKPRNMKRNRVGMIGSSTADLENSEPDEKRPAFRLQPPTLIHEKAKPVPKSEEDTANTSTRCKFLQPPRLPVPSTNTEVPSTTKEEHSAIIAQPRALVSSSNPFLMIEKETGEELKGEKVAQEDKGAVGCKVYDNVGITDSKAPVDAEPDSTTDVTVTNEVALSDQQKEENLFLQAARTLQNGNTSSSNFVFGINMVNRVTLNNESQLPNKNVEEGDSVTSSSSASVFGQSLSENAKVSSSTDATTNLFLPATTDNGSSSADAALASKDSPCQSPTSSSSEKKSGLEEDAAAHFLASQARPVVPEVEVVTGEENEKNVLQVQCKLHQFESATQNWLERGAGSLRLNDAKYSSDEFCFQSRLVMRVRGSLRLVLNTKIWPQMIVEKASQKAIRISAQTEDGGIGIFLIRANINDTEQMFRALEYRVLQQNQLEERLKKSESDEQPSQAAGDSSSDISQVATDLTQKDVVAKTDGTEDKKSGKLSCSPVANIDSTSTANVKDVAVTSSEIKQTTASVSNRGDSSSASTLPDKCDEQHSTSPS